MTEDTPYEAAVAKTAHSIADALGALESEFDARFDKLGRHKGGVPQYPDAEPPNLDEAERKILAGEEPEHDERWYAVDKYEPETLTLADGDTRAEFAKADEGTFEEWWHCIISTLELNIPNWETHVARVTYNDHGNQRLIITSSSDFFTDSLKERNDDDDTVKKFRENVLDEDVPEVGPKLFGDDLPDGEESPFDSESDDCIDFALKYKPGHGIDARFLVRAGADGEWSPLSYDPVKSISDSKVEILHGEIDYTLQVEHLAEKLAKVSTLSPRESEVALLDSYGHGNWTKRIIGVSPSTLRSQRSAIERKSNRPDKKTPFTREAAERGFKTGLIPSEDCTPLPEDIATDALEDAEPISDVPPLRWEPFHDHAPVSAGDAIFYEVSDETAILKLVEEMDVWFYSLDRDAVADEHEFIASGFTTHGRWEGQERQSTKMP